jgi:hypothetical protein
MSKVDNLLSELNNLPSVFTYDEQELIRRVFISIYNQISSTIDRNTAKNILHKTEWIIGI